MKDYYLTGDAFIVEDKTYVTGFILHTWTKNKPIEEGWYWIHADNFIQMTYVTFSDNNGLTLSDMDYTQVEDVTHWMGPIPKPETPEF